MGVVSSYARYGLGKEAGWGKGSSAFHGHDHRWYPIREPDQRIYILHSASFVAAVAVDVQT